MIGTTSCPKCQQNLAVPGGTAEQAEVRCPSCDEQFMLADSLPSDLPTLVVVNNPIEETLPVADSNAAAAVEAANEAGPDWTPDIADDQSSSDAPTFEGVGVSDEAAPTEASEGDGDADGADEQEEGDEPDFSFGEAAPVAFDAADFSSGEEGEAAAAPAKPKKMGMMGNIIGIVVFGIVGLGLGYGALFLLSVTGIKPGATASVDEIFASFLPSGAGDDVAKKPAENGKPATPEADGSNDFVPGNMLPNSNPPSDTTPPPEQPVPEDTFPNVDPADSVFDASPAAGDRRAFGALLGGQDPAGVMKNYAADEVEATLASSRAVANDGAAKLVTIYFSMCDLGDRLALIDDAAGGRIAQSATEAEDLILQVANPALHASLIKFSHQWLNRPADKAPDKTGVLLVGKVKFVVPYDNLFASEIEIQRGDEKQRVLVMTPTRPDYHVSDMAGVLGTVIKNPAAKLPGLNLEDQQLDKIKADRNLLILSRAAVKLKKK